MTPDDMAAHYEAQTGVVELNRSWPGLDAPSRETEVDTDAMLTFARDLEDEVDRVTGPTSTLTRLNTVATTSPPPGELLFGAWDTGHRLHQRLVDARFYVMTVYGDMITELRNAIALVRREAADVLGDEEATRAGFDQYLAGAPADPAGGVPSPRPPPPPPPPGDSGAAGGGGGGAG